MANLGEKIRELRKKKKMTQEEFANMLFVTDKTVSSWERNRTMPDINMLFKISSVVESNIYSLLSNDIVNINELEIEVKLKLDSNLFNKLLNRMLNEGKLIEEVEQRDIYYVSKYKEFLDEWLRIRSEDGKNILTYKKKESESYCLELETLFDNYDNLDKILSNIEFNKKGIICKKRIKIMYKGKYEISFDYVLNVGLFLEIEVKRIDSDKKEEVYELMNLLNLLKLDISLIDSKRYYDYLED